MRRRVEFGGARLHSSVALAMHFMRVYTWRRRSIHRPGAGHAPEMALIFYYAIKSGTTRVNVRPKRARSECSEYRSHRRDRRSAGGITLLGLEIGAPRRMVPFLSAKSRIAWYNFLMIRFLNARNRLYALHTRWLLLLRTHVRITAS